MAAGTAESEYTYNTLGRLETFVNPEQEKIELSYFPVNSGVDSKHANGELKTATIDPAGLGISTHLTFDDSGNVISVNGPRTDVSDNSSR